MQRTVVMILTLAVVFGGSALAQQVQVREETLANGM